MGFNIIIDHATIHDGEDSVDAADDSSTYTGVVLHDGEDSTDVADDASTRTGVVHPGRSFPSRRRPHPSRQHSHRPTGFFDEPAPDDPAQQPSPIFHSTIDQPWYAPPSTIAQPWNAQPATVYPSHTQPSATKVSYAQPATSYPYYVQPAATYPSYPQSAPNYSHPVQPASSYHSIQPSTVYPPQAQAGPGHSSHAQYLSSYPLYTQSMPVYSNDVQKPSEERQPHHEGIQRRDTLNLGHSKPHRLLHFSILLRSNKKVIEDEESGFYKGNYPLARDSGRLKHSTLENSNAKNFDIVSTECIPAEDGCQTISLVLMDEMAMRSQDNVRCESHWRHLNLDVLSFEQLYKQATEIGCIEDDDLAIVAQLLNKVQKTSEKKFVYGRYLKPTTVVYYGEESSGAMRKISKTATFVSLPVFWLERPREHTSTKDSAGHPSRALLQSRYRLETTENRDQEQVIAKSRPNEKRIVHVPQIWALIINRNVIITSAPLDASVLCGDSIKTIPYAVARVDEATWSVHFRDTYGNPFYLPLRLCKTWFVRQLLGLVRYISSVCLDDQEKRIQDELLSAGPLHKIVTEDGAIVNAETWPRMIEAKKADLIHLKLVSESFNFIVQGNVSNAWQNAGHSALSPDTEEGGFGDHLGLHPINTDEISPRISELEQLRRLQIHLRDTILQAEGAQVYELKGMQMPVLEALIHELTINPSEVKWCDVPGLENITFLRDPGSSGNDVHNGERPEIQNRPKPAISPYNKTFSTVDHDKDTGHAEEATLPEDANETYEARDNKEIHYTNQIENMSEINRMDVPAEAEDSEDTDGADAPEEIKDAASIEITKESEELYNIEVIYEIEEIDDTLEADDPDSDEKIGELNDLGENYSIQMPDECYEPDQVNTFYESNYSTSVEEDMSSGQVNEQVTNQQKGPRTTTRKSREAIAEADSHSQQPTIEAETRAGYPRNKPRLEKLLRLARKEVSRALNIKRPSVAVESVILPFQVPEADHLPIFLWPIGETEPNSFAYPSHNVATAGNPEELILHKILKEAHAKLGNMSGGLPKQRENAVSYEIAESKTAVEVNIFLYEIRRRGLNGSNQEGEQDHINRENAEILTAKGIIFDLSDKIIHAFVPRECESPLVAKYWGSVFGFLTEKDVAVSRNFILRLRMLWSLIEGIHRGVQTTDGSRQSFHIPQALPAAFQQLVMFFVFSSSTSLEAATMTSFESCKALLLEAKKQLIMMNHTFDLRGRVDFQAVDPQALLALMVSNLVTKISPEGDCDLTEVYSEYALEIQHMVRDRASVQVYDKIKLLQEEIDVIKAGLVQQDSVLRDFKSIIWESRHGASLSKNVADRVLESIQQRIEDFDELQVQADNARFLAAQSISLKAENNSKAILVFTVTTIIFLPLSFVTSYLGMNTSDLRSTSSGQSLFWAVGVPLTLVVLGCALVAAFFGSLRQRALRAMKWFKDKCD